MLLLALLAVLAGAEGFTDIARFGKKKLALLRRYRPFANGTPSHDHLGDIFASLDPVAFRRCFVAWTARLTGAPAGVIAIDGKTSRRSGRKGGEDLLHMVSAFAARNHLVLGQIKTDAKSNEITAIPRLLEMISVEGAVVTIDAMGCQRAIAQKILDRKADYILALKGNQGTLCRDVGRYVEKHKKLGFKGIAASVHETQEDSHGRTVTRRVRVIADVDWLNTRHDWPGLKSVVVIESTRQIGDKTACETRSYLASGCWDAKCAGGMIRDHWAVENSLHWIMDMNFGDDACRVRTGNAAENFVALKHMAANLARRAPGKDSVRLRLKTAAWDDAYLERLISP